MDDPLKTAQRQTKRYWYVDGLTEMGSGILIVIFGITYLIIGLIEPNEAANWLMGIGQPLVFIVGWLMVTWQVKRLKESITYPRTGYVSYRQPRGKQRLLGVVVTMLVAAGFGIAAVAGARIAGEALVPVLIGVLLGGAIAYLGYQYELIRFYALGAFTLGLGILCSLLGLSDKFSMAVFFCGFGAGWIVSGGWTLRNYLRNTAPLVEGEE